MKKLFTITLHTLLILALVSVAVVSAASLLPIPGALEIKIVQSGSMEPAIATGGVVVIQPTREYVVGDVVTFGEDTAVQVPTTHRIVGERRDGNTTYFTTKGDANEEADTNEVAGSEIIGRVLFSVPYLGYVIDFSKKPIGFLLLIVIPAVLIILYECVGIYEEIRKHLQKKKKSEDNIYTQRVRRAFDITPARPTSVSVKKQKLRAIPIACIALLFPLTTTLLGGSGSTILFLSDTERSAGNLFDAGRLDISLSVSEATEATIGLGEAAGHTITPVITVPPLTLPFSYTVDAVTGGNPAFCNALQVIGTPPPLSYNGSVNGFSVGTTSDQTPWALHFFVPDGAVISANAQCMITITYDAFQDGGLPGIEYHDEEQITLLLTFSSLSPVAPLQQFSIFNESMLILDEVVEGPQPPFEEVPLEESLQGEVTGTEPIGPTEQEEPAPIVDEPIVEEAPEPPPEEQVLDEVPVEPSAEGA